MGSNANAKERPPAQRGITPAAPEEAAEPVYERAELSRILAEREAWTKVELAEALGRLPRRRERLETDSGIPIPDVLDPTSRREEDYRRDLGWPGAFPYTRG